MDERIGLAKYRKNCRISQIRQNHQSSPMWCQNQWMN